MRGPVVVGFIIFVMLAAIAAVLAAVFLPFHGSAGATADLEVTAARAAAPLTPGPQYLPPRAAEAPEAIRALVLRGQAIMVRRTEPGRPRTGLACSSCHFSGGLNDGGKNHGFSLVGVAARYPTATPLATLPARIADCFRKNLNTAPPSTDDGTLAAIDAYLRWISSGVPFLSEVPWLNTEPLATAATPDPVAGERTWRDSCAPCHGDHGEGTRIAPATAGPDSFTAESQLLASGILERFIKNNMPRGTPDLTDKAAVDVAAFVRGQPHPHARAP